jgi:hypothetical protein
MSHAHLASAFAALLLPLCAAAQAGQPFPLPAPDGKALAVSPGQKAFRLPVRFEAAERFYRQQFDKQEGIRIHPELKDGRRLLRIESKRSGELWAKATLREGELETIVELVPVLRADETTVQGKAAPLVIVIPRSREAAKMADEMEHLERPNRP